MNLTFWDRDQLEGSQKILKGKMGCSGDELSPFLLWRSLWEPIEDCDVGMSHGLLPSFPGASMSSLFILGCSLVRDPNLVLAEVRTVTPMCMMCVCSFVFPCWN